MTKEKRRFLFNAKNIDSLETTGKQIDYWDTAIEHFGIRVSAKGKKAWVYVYRYQRRQRRLTLGHYPALSLADAREKAHAARGDLANGKDPAATKDAQRQSGTFGDLAADYLAKHAKPKKRTWQEDERIINKEFLPSWRHKKLNDFRRRDIRTLIDGIATDKARVMANRCLSLVKTIFAFGVSGDWLEFNPATGVRPPAKENRRDRVLSQEEIHALWQTLDQETPLSAAVLRLQLLTAQRISEVLTMTWDDVDLTTGWWTIPAERSKNGRPHQVPLSTSGLEIVKGRQGLSSSPFVFPAPRNNKKAIQLPTIHKAVERLRVSAGIDFRTHDLRRTAATSMAAAGVTGTVLGKILNHSDRSVTALHYNWHTYDSDKKLALDAWGRTIQEIVKGEREFRKVLSFPT